MKGGEREREEGGRKGRTGRTFRIIRQALSFSRARSCSAQESSDSSASSPSSRRFVRRDVEGKLATLLRMEHRGAPREYNPLGPTG